MSEPERLHMVGPPVLRESCVRRKIQIVTLQDTVAEFDRRIEALDRAQENVQFLIDLEELQKDIDAATNLHEDLRIPCVEAEKNFQKLIQHGNLCNAICNSKIPQNRNCYWVSMAMLWIYYHPCSCALDASLN